MASPLKKKSVLIDDVPLCSMDKVIENIETKKFRKDIFGMYMH